ncbi:CDP-glycerol glycerophosphotransferase family protein [Anaerospora sp.]|uniref:CDP-glycerol glycerophosphotransferase family protein n=1 Tax=Anaerospora sp. TaxID=1960278 RepID=UPI002899E90E|nr:CDP-glycerol glycerophosphotransferase family protein [Anaerospora sp.]
MRNFQQKKILEMIQTLAEANAEIKRLFLQGEVSSFLQVLADCQEFVAAICGFIEEIEGEGTQTVALLGEYYELLYQASLAAEQKKNRSFLKHLKEKLSKITNSVKTEFKPNKLEVAFFPYNASMWDSLESVWLAANADPCCDAYVVPVPYYELLPNGTFGKMHYEGSEYPDNVPITDWREYNIETRCPDVVFIHYAYDNAAHNARIHPDFYSKRLREHCGQLVYIPYFVPIGDVVEDYCVTLPGVLYADKVIVQSEAQRQSYIKLFKQYGKQGGWNGCFGNPMEKFVALGSPKYDKVLSTKKEEYSLPEEWERRIYRKDGTRKKVIFYNTHMFTWLNGGEQYFKKLQAVFEFFLSRDDVVLLWRPHPNTELNFRTLQPQSLNKYMRVIKEYKEAGWGIYDDTSDLHRSIAISDAYYGDGSSVVSLFTAADKPVMLQNINENYSTEPYILPTCLYIDNEYIWYTLYGKNGLFRMDKQTGKSTFVSQFPDVPNNGEYLFLQSVAKVADTMFFTPCAANHIITYNMVNQSMTSIPLKPAVEIAEINYNYLQEYKFHDVFAYGSKVFFIGLSYPAIVCLDALTGEIDYYTEWVPEFVKQMKSHSEYILTRAACQNGSVIVATSDNTNAVLLFDMATCKTEVFKIDKATNWANVCFDGVDYWLVPKNNALSVRWNLKKNIITEYNTFPANFLPGEYHSIKILSAGNYIWLFPYKGNMILKINRDNGNMKIVREIDNHLGSFSGYMFACLSGGKIYAIPRCGNVIEEYDVITEEWNIRPLNIEEVLTGTKGSFDSLSSMLYQEGGLCNAEYLTSIVDDNNYIGYAKREEMNTLSIITGSAGRSIYDFIKALVI